MDVNRTAMWLVSACRVTYTVRCDWLDSYRLIDNSNFSLAYFMECSFGQVLWPRPRVEFDWQVEYLEYVIHICGMDAWLELFTVSWSNFPLLLLLALTRGPCTVYVNPDRPIHLQFDRVMVVCRIHEVLLWFCWIWCFAVVIRLAHIQPVVRLSRLRSRKLREIRTKFRYLYEKSGSESKNMTSDFASPQNPQIAQNGDLGNLSEIDAKFHHLYNRGRPARIWRPFFTGSS